MEYLVATKWSDGFICEQFSHQKYCNGKLKQTRECTSCGYQATPTSGTLPQGGYTKISTTEGLLYYLFHEYQVRKGFFLPS